VLDRSGEVIQVARLRRLRIDVRPYDSEGCYQRDENPIVLRAPDDGAGAGVILITIRRP